MKQFGQKIKKIVNKTKSQKLDMVDRLEKSTSATMANQSRLVRTIDQGRS